MAALTSVATNGMATFSGLKAVSSSNVATFRTAAMPKRVSACCASAEECAHGQAGETVMLASVSTSTAPAPSPLSTIPTVLGAGLLGAAAVALISKKTPEKVPEAVAPQISAPAPVLTGNAFLSDYGAIPARAKAAAPAAISTMATTFPGAVTEEIFVKSIANELAPFGFTKDNCIALINTCRDEVCRPLVNLVDKEFGLSFNISGLGGLINAGTVGFGAGMAHSPEFPCDRDGIVKERYIFLAFPHVSVGETGEVGSLLRRGRGKPSNACGALIAIKGDVSKGAGPINDEWNGEYNLLKKKVIAKLPKPQGDYTLAQVTKAALQAITEDLEKLISLAVDPKKADYAVITGIQIHSGAQVPGEPFLIERTCDYIAPYAAYAVLGGKKVELQANTRKTAVKA